MPTTTRRSFARKAALAAAAPAIAKGWQSAPNETVNIAVVGFRGRGRDHYRSFSQMPNVRVTHLCDVDERLFERGVREVEEIAGHRPKTVVDFRKLIEEKDIDAVSIATPDHWHALQAIWACQAGKDVYVEKPVSYTLREGRMLVRAAHKYQRMVQVGLQRRSDPRTHSVMKFVHDASFGTPYRAKSVVFRGRASIGKVQESSIPAGVNWDLYLGPAPYTAFTLNKFHYGWHFFWGTSTTEVGNNGVHSMDLLRWGLKKRVHPVRISCSGGRYADDSDQEVPNVQLASYTYEDGTLLDIEATTLYAPPFGGVHMGSFFYTPEGYISSANNWTTVRGKFTPQTTPDPPSGISLRASNLSFPKISYEPGPSIPDIEEKKDMGMAHFENFIDCVRSRKRQELNCEVEDGHMSTSLCHLANIAYRTCRTLTFDPMSETFPDDKEANALLTRKYREPYTLPAAI